MRILALVLLAAASVAQAQPDIAPPPPVSRAKQLYSEGKRFYDVGEFAKAVEAWKESYVLSTAPMLLFNIAQAYRLSGDCVQALRFYSNYEREASNLTNRDELDQARARCNPHPTGAHPPPTEPVLPGTPTTTTNPTTNPTTTTTEPPTTATPTTEPTTTATTSLSAGPSDDRSSLRTAGVITLGGGAAALGVSLALALRARDKASQVETFRGEWTTEQRSIESAGNRAATWSVITGVAGALILVAGGGIYYYGTREAPRRALDVAIGPNAAEVSWSVSF